MYSAQETDNMFLNFLSNVFAFAFACFITISTTDTISLPLTFTDLLSIIINPETYIYLLKAVFSGMMALGIKFFGDILIYKWKEKKNKGKKSNE